MSSASSQAISGVNFGNEEGNSSLWLALAVVVAGGLIAWAMFKQK